MNSRRPHTFLLLLSLAACGDPSGPEVVVSSVEITAPTLTIDVGLFVQFQARAFGSGGQQLSGLTVEWSSSNTNTASIDEDGLATALAVGTSAITASIGGVSASEVLVVQPSQCTGRVDVVLNPGEYQAYDGDQCLLLPSGSAGDYYRVAVVRPTLIQDSTDVPQVTLQINPIFATAAAAAVAADAPAGAPSAGAAPGDALVGLRGIDGARFAEELEIRGATRRFHHELRERELALGLHLRDALPSRPALAPPALVDPPARADMYLDLDCSVTTLRPVILIDFSDNLAIYQDSVAWSSSPMPTAATDQMIAYYDDYVFDMIPQYWGDPSDIDGNGRIIVVTSPEMPESAAAAVYSGDFLAPASCASSNQGEVVYFAEDVISSLADADPSYLALGVLAHEVKHVVSIYNGVVRGAFHNTWIEEGTAEVSQVMSSRIAWAATGGPAVGAEITGNDIIDAVNANPNREVTPEMWGVVGELADVIANLSTQPNSLITNPVGRAEFHSFYAASWHWHRFIGDAFGNASTPYADAPLFKALTDSLGAAGVAGLLQQTGRSFDQLFEDVVVALSLHKSGPEPSLAFSTWNLFSATAIFSSPAEIAPPSDYPWPITTDLGGNAAKGFTTAVYSCPPQLVAGSYQLPAATDRCRMGPSGIRVHDFVSQGTGLGAQILVTGVPTGRIIVTRLN